MPEPLAPAERARSSAAVKREDLLRRVREVLEPFASIADESESGLQTAFLAVGDAEISSRDFEAARELLADLDGE